MKSVNYLKIERFDLQFLNGAFKRETNELFSECNVYVYIYLNYEPIQVRIINLLFYVIKERNNK